MTWWSWRQHRVIRPEPRNGALFRTYVQSSLKHFKRLFVELRSFVFAVFRWSGQSTTRTIRHGERTVLAPVRKKWLLLLRDYARWHPIGRALCQFVRHGEAHVFNDSTAIIVRPCQYVLRHRAAILFT